MKQYESQVKYQSSVPSQGYAPIKGPNLAPALRRNMEEQVNDLQRVQAAESQNYQKDELKLSLNNIDPNYIEQLSKFSNTLMDFGRDQLKAYDESEQAAALAYFYENEEELVTERAQFKAGKDTVNAVHNVTQQAAIQSSKDGQPYEATSLLEGLSGRRKLYVSIHAAKAIGGNYQEYVTKGLAEDPTVLEMGDISFAVNKQNKTLQEEAAARAYLREQFMANFSGIPRGLLAEHAFPTMREADVKIASAYRTQVAVRESDISRQEAYQTYFTDLENNPNATSQLLNSLAITVDAKGNRLGYPGAWKKFEQFAKDMAGSENAIDFNEVRKQVVIGDAKDRTFGELYDVKLTAIEDDIQAEQNARFSQDEATTRNYLKQQEREILSGLPEDATDADLDAAQEAYMELSESLGVFGKSQAIENFKTYGTEDAQIRKAKIARFEYLQQRGLLDPDVISREGYEIYNRFHNIAQQQERQRNESGGTKVRLTAIEGLVKTNDRVKSLPDGTTGGETTLVIAELQDSYLVKFQEYLSETDGNAAKAADLAYQDVQNLFREGLEDDSSRYYIDDSGKFKNLFKEQAHSKESQKLRGDIARIGAVVQSNGASAFDSPTLFGSKSYFENLEKNFGERGWKMPPRISYWANKLGVSPFEIINRQMEALDMDALPAYQQLADQAQQASPEYRRFLNNLVSGKASPMELQRGVLPVQSLPLRSSFAIADGSEGSRLRSAITTKESGGRYDVTNQDSGALGIGQVMPANVPSWTMRHLGYTMTPQQYLDNPVAQEKVVSGQLELIIEQQRSAGYTGEELIRRAAAVWYSGRSNLWNDNEEQYTNGRRYPSIAEYTKDIWRRYSGQ